MQTESESEFHWNAQSILGTATIFTDLGTMTDVSLLVVTAHAGDELEKLGVLGAAVARNDRREDRKLPAELVVYPFVIKYKHTLVLSPTPMNSAIIHSLL